MKTTVEKLSPTRAKLSISVTPEELKPSIAEAYKTIAGQVSIPGFRKGKVPPPIIDQRVGRAVVLEQAVNQGLDGFYRSAVDEHSLRPLGRPEADIATWPSDKDFSGDLELTIEVDVRPEVTLPDYSKITLTVEAAEVTDADVDEELDRLRSRFGTLVPADRPAKKGDFTQLDLVARIGDEEVDTASSVSYELGSGELIEGIDEALDSLSAGEATTFRAPLLGGDHEGEEAEITVTLTAVKERELPDADDDFAQIASEFDTIAELREGLREQAARGKTLQQGSEARDKLVEKLLEIVEIPVPQQLIEDEVHRHLESENRLDDDEHRKEVAESSEKAFRSQILLDSIVEAEKVDVSQDEITQYLVQGAMQYNMEPNEFIQALSENGQLPQVLGEVSRNKALAVVLGRVTVKDTKGKKVDLDQFVVKPDEGDADASSATDEAAESGEAEKPKKAAAKKAPAKKKPDAKKDAKTDDAE